MDNTITAVVISEDNKIIKEFYISKIKNSPDDPAEQDELFQYYKENTEQYLIKDLNINMNEIDSIICKDLIDPIKIHIFKWNKEKNKWKETVLEKDLEKYIDNIK